MGSEWKVSSLGDTCYITDGAHAKVERQSDGVLYLTSKNIDVGSLKLDNVDYISEADFQRLFTETKKSQRKLQDGDVLTGIIGTFGNAYRYTSEDHFGISSSIAILRPNQKILDSDFLYYVITSRPFRATVEAYKGGSVQGYTNIATLKTLPIPLPDLESQKVISKTLRSIDTKIELNRQINTTLEAMAQALFKSWFVDFDPVIDNALAAGNPIPPELAARAERRQQHHARANTSADAQTTPYQPLPANIQQQFPDRFVFTEAMGWVPEGWGAGTLADIAFYAKDKINTSELDLDNYISTENMNVEKSGVCRASSLPNAVQVPRFSKGETLISNIRPYFKKIWLASFCGGRSNDVLGFQAKNSAANEYVYNLLYQDAFFDYMTATSKGTKMPRGDKVAIMGWPTVIPQSTLMEEFSNLVKPSYLANQLRSDQSSILAEARDSLLPKLLSGQLRIPDAEAAVDKALAEA